MLIESRLYLRPIPSLCPSTPASFLCVLPQLGIEMTFTTANYSSGEESDEESEARPRPVSKMTQRHHAALALLVPRMHAVK